MVFFRYSNETGGSFNKIIAWIFNQFLQKAHKKSLQIYGLKKGELPQIHSLKFYVALS